MEGRPESTAISGLEDDDYVHVDSSEKLAELQRAEDFQMMPTLSMKDPFSLTAADNSELNQRNSTSLERTDAVALSMGSVEGNIGGNLGDMKQKPPLGKTAAFLDSKGFGWLMEIEDEEEDVKPLL